MDEKGRLPVQRKGEFSVCNQSNFNRTKYYKTKNQANAVKCKGISKGIFKNCSQLETIEDINPISGKRQYYINCKDNSFENVIPPLLENITLISPLIDLVRRAKTLFDPGLGNNKCPPNCSYFRSARVDKVINILQRTFYLINSFHWQTQCLIIISIILISVSIFKPQWIPSFLEITKSLLKLYF